MSLRKRRSQSGLDVGVGGSGIEVGDWEAFCAVDGDFDGVSIAGSWDGCIIVPSRRVVLVFELLLLISELVLRSFNFPGRMLLYTVLCAFIYAVQ